jgi:hypothetical protein
MVVLLVSELIPELTAKVLLLPARILHSELFPDPVAPRTTTFFILNNFYNLGVLVWVIICLELKLDQLNLSNQFMSGTSQPKKCELQNAGVL